MKKIAFILFSIFCMSELSAQCDNPYYQLKEGTRIVTENFDKKDKFQGRTETNVSAYNETSTGFEATMSVKIYDKKEKVVSEGEYKLACENGSIKIDMSSFVPQESMGAFKDAEMEVVMGQLEYPKDLSTGQNLRDASIEMKSSGPIPMKLVVDITDRKVEGKESVTTPAGTFDCFRISYNTHSKMMIANMNFKTVEFLSEKCGAVRTETYKSNGNLMSYTVVTKYEY